MLPYCWHKRKINRTSNPMWISKTLIAGEGALFFATNFFLKLIDSFRNLPFERIHLKFCKYILDVQRKYINFAADWRVYSFQFTSDATENGKPPSPGGGDAALWYCQIESEVGLKICWQNFLLLNILRMHEDI